MVSACLYAVSVSSVDVSLRHVTVPGVPSAGEHYTLKIGNHNGYLTLFLSREQLVKIHDCIRDGYVPEIPTMRPVAARVIHPDVVLATEDDIEEARR